MNEENILLLTKYLNNECTRQELIEVANLLTDPSNQGEVSGLLEQASRKFHGYYKTTPEHQKKSWSKIHSEISRPGDTANKNFRPKQIWLKIAASLILLLGVGLLIRLSLDSVQNPVKELAVQQKTARNELGKKSRLTLPDGTVVIMNSGTIISYPEKFSDDIRSVSLKGEAYFDVKEDSSHPFVVNVQGIKTKVLGTTFNIRAYDYNNNIKVSLTSGKIAMQLPDDSTHLILRPGQEMIYDLGASTYEVNEFDSEQVLGWQEGILYFNEASEKQAINMLEHWYDVDIEIVNSTSNEWKNLTAKYNNEPLENVLISLGYTLSFNYEIDGRNIKIIYK
ncbi:FecR domain-containing protein [Fulvivirgaceae bacterium BMA10]|uniref:FecR domain-containing protein n=1 Tax=Splendidivirga corallicola TaxID=3051826 RepID=A0ABT8KY56_9BACT|nr:FecR domain-containing protein [Fulvivirgaceae bacterium BMA10]